MSDADLLIIGAGPAGLWAAWRAAQAGHNVILLEKGTTPGGMAGSFMVAGQSVDYGSHRLHASIEPKLMTSLQELLGDDLQSRIRNGRLRLNDRWVGFPLRTLDLLRNVTPRFALGATLDSLLSPFRQPKEETFSAYLRAGLGKTVSEMFYEPYAEKLWGSTARELDAELARRRVAASSPYAIIRRLVKGAKTEGRRFWYPRLGYGQICLRLAEAATKAGADLRFATAVNGLNLESNQIVAITGNNRITASRCWSTAPISALVKYISPEPPDEILKAIGELQHRAMVLVYLVCDQPRYTSFDAHYLPGPDTPLSRLSEAKNYRDGPDPANRTVLCAEIPCWEGDHIWNASDEELGALAAESLVIEDLPIPRHIATETRRLPHVYPIYTPGYRRHLDLLMEWVSTYDRLTVLGRQGLFVPDNLHHVLAMSAAAVDALNIDGSFSQEAWTTALDGFTQHVVED